MASPWPFLGREAEQLALTGRLASGTGTLLLGEPGVGKSALARRVRITLGEGRAGLIVGHAVSSGTPFEAFAGTLADHSDGTLVLRSSPPVIADRVATRLGATPATPVALFVDDIHLVDESSAQALLQLASDARVIVVGTAPAIRDVPTAVERLWHDGLCELVELAPLGDEVVTEIVESVLDGPLDTAVAGAFRSRARGNPLVLRELVTAALAGGTLQRDGRTWTLTGELVPGSGLRNLVAARLERVPEPQRVALDALAATEPLPLAAAEQLVGAELLDELEAARLVTVRDGLAGPTVGCAHPLYGDVVRANLPPLRRHRLRLAAARALDAGSAPTAHDVVRAALWRLEAGQDDAPDRLLAAARAACSFSLATAERLARAAHARSPSPPATVLLAEILTYRNQGAEAAELTATLPPESLSAQDREAIAYCAGLGQGLLTGNADTGERLVAGVLAGSGPAADHLRALHSTLLAFDARFEDSITVGAPILHDAAKPRPARALAAVGVVGSAYWLGRTRQALAEAARVPRDADDVRESVPFAVPSIELIEVCALVEEGSLAAAEQRATSMRCRAEADDDRFAWSRSLYCEGRVALALGRCRTALELFGRSLDLVMPFDRMSRRHIGAMVAQAASALGDIAAASAGLDLPDAPVLKTYEQQRILAEAALLAAQLHLEEAAERAAWAGGVAADLSQWSIATSAYHDALRYGAGRSLLTPLQDAATHLEGPLAGCLVAHGEALVHHDGPALQDVAGAFEQLGFQLLAAEAAAEAALAYAARHELRPARASGRLSESLFARCEGATSPWLTGAPSGVALTSRERQVVALAVAGRSDAGIASELGISVRTIQTHLAHAYAKLGVTSRRQLAQGLVAGA